MVSLYVLVQSLENITTVARYFLPREDDCYQFPWGGCAGGANMFVSRGACLATCRVTGPPPRVGRRHVDQRVEDDLPSTRCGQPPSSGPCADTLTRYYYDGDTCHTWVILNVTLVILSHEHHVTVNSKYLAVGC